ncbi:MAG: hypothetical protein CMH49_07085 [Myxococcales bacterium]|nr:hypothetical protein [Myxococcales bacterium]
MLTTLIEIAWGDRANGLNQIFSLLFILIFVIQSLRFVIFWDKINQWSRAFVSAKLAFDQDGSIKIESRMDELQPPHSASAQLWIVLPPVIIMFGLIGTFIGLTLALALIPFGGTAAEIQTGVQSALPSMGSAFWTSLSAICAAMTIRLTTMFMESMFNRRVLKVIVSAHPDLIQHIEREAFLHNRPGALLRPHSLRELLWQQNRDLNQQINHLGEVMSSSIHGLTSALLSSEQVYNSEDSKDQKAPHDRIADQNLSNSLDTSSTDLSQTSSEQTQLNEILSEMKHQTQLLEQLVHLQSQNLDGQRVAQSTLAFAKIKDHQDV